MSGDPPPRWHAATVKVGKPASDDDDARSVFDPVAPRFDEVGELGRGGMGRVAEAVDRALARTVAVKYMLATDADATARFEREVRITARLQHPAIVPVLDAGRDRDGNPYYVMRKIDGVPLASKVAGATVRDRLALVPAVLAAIDATAYAHARGVIHRDIKPSNMLLGPFGETLLIDWGLARELDAPHGELPSARPPPRAPGSARVLTPAGPTAATVPATPVARTAPAGAAGEGGEAAGTVDPDATAGTGDLTRLGAAYGTPGYMSPEQARGEVLDRRTDVYSLGASLYFVLTAATPFDGIAPTVAIDRVADGESPDLTRIPEEVPIELAAIVKKALAADRDARYADAAEMAADVRRFLAGQLVAAHRYTTAQRIARWLRRHRLVATISAIAIVVLAVGGTLAVRRIVAERDRARAARAVAEARAEETLLDRARSLTRVDPTSALAILRTLPAGSPRWPIAREITRAAVTGGVERLIARHDGSVHVVAYSPNGTLAAAWFGDGSPGTIEVIPPGADRGRVVAVRAATALCWIGDHVLVAASQISGEASQVELIDTTTTTTTPVSVTDVSQMACGDSRVVVRGKDGSVRAADVTGAVTGLADAGIAAIDASGGRIAMLARDKLIVIEPDGRRRERVVEMPGVVYRVLLSPGGERIAAAVGGAKIEFATFDDPRPKLWPSAMTGLSALVYAGDNLYDWSTVAGGVVSLGDGGAVARWLAPTEGTVGYIAAGGRTAAIVASSNGQLAYAAATGAFAIPHRPIPVRAIAIDARGTEAAIGTTEGELLRLDLSAAVPVQTPIARGTELYALDGDHVVVGADPGTVQGFDLASPAPGTTASLDIIDLATGAHHPLDPLGFGTFGWVERGRIVLIGGRPQTALIVDPDGTVRYRAEVGSTALSHDALVVETPGHDVVRIDLADPDHPQVLAHVDGQIAMIETLDDRVVVVTFTTPDRFDVNVLDKRGMHRLDLGSGTMLSSIHQTPDGTWWYVENFDQLWRKPVDGPAAQVPVGQRVQVIQQDGARIWALSATTQFELDPAGRILRTTSAVGRACTIEHGSVLDELDSLAVTMSEVNVRRILPIGGAPQQTRASRDGRAVATIVQRLDDSYAIALWRDPVPVDPAALPAYLDRVTNARLDPGSDQVLWAAVTPR